MAFSQKALQKNILYLIPFHTDHTASINLSEIENDDQLESQPSFQLVGFWNGTKIALEEFKNDSVHINVIVRDITTNIAKLRDILGDKEFMSSIDLIIGPFYHGMFSIAAEYAKEYKIPIVNPFSTRQDILDSNEFVYKATPTSSVEPHLFYDLILANNRDANIILWSDNDQDAVFKVYEDEFAKQELEPVRLFFNADITTFTSTLKPYRQNVVIVQANAMGTVINNFRTLYARDKYPEFLLLIPEKWVTEIYSELEIFNAFHAHYFSNYYVNYQNEKVIYFMSEYVEYHNAPPTLEHFAFQGYDLTHYFLQALVHDFDLSKINVQPLAMDFQFVKTKKGGFENQKKRLLMIEEYGEVEVK
jgi:ABC-type branched-subunit amino acid transport system substrate-binding protein